MKFIILHLTGIKKKELVIFPENYKSTFFASVALKFYEFEWSFSVGLKSYSYKIPLFLYIPNIFRRVF